MKNGVLLIAVILAIIVPAAPAFAANENTVMEFGNFANYYRVWKTDTCNIYKGETCPSEFGWQGKKIKFNFIIDENEALTDTLTLRVSVGSSNYGGVQDALVNITAGGKKKLKLAAKSPLRAGEYEFEVPASIFKKGKKNWVTIEAKNVKVGYGRNPPNFVLSEIALERNQ